MIKLSVPSSLNMQPPDQTRVGNCMILGLSIWEAGKARTNHQFQSLKTGHHLLARLKCLTVELVIYHGRISKDGGISWKFASSLFEHPSDQIETGGNHSDGSLW